MPLTLALKHQLRLNDRLLNETSLIDEMLLGPSVSTDAIYFHPYFNLFKDYLPETFTIFSWIKIQNNLFKPKFVLNLSVTNMLPVFGIIHFIYLNRENKPFIVLQILETLSFSRHLYSYRVSFTKKWKILKCKKSINKHSVTSLVKSIDADYFVIQE